MKTRIPVKLLAALTSLCLLLTFGVFAMADDAAADVVTDVAGIPETGMPYYNPDMSRALNSGLYFKGGLFKILVLSDLDIGIAPYPAMLKAIDYMIQDTQPDLIVLNGDVTRKGSSVLGITGSGVSIAWICDMIPRNIPFTVTFGENDALLPMSKNSYLSRYQRYSNFVGFDDMPVVEGVGSHNLFIFADSSSKALTNAAFNLWMLDTNNDGLFRLEAEWYGSKEVDVILGTLEELYTIGYSIPSMVFTHKSMLDTAGVAGTKKMIDNMGDFGNVLAAVSSHNRTVSRQTKNFVTSLQGNAYSLDFIETPGMAYSGKGDQATRGGTLITLQLVSPAEPEKIVVIEEGIDDEPDTVETVYAQAPVVSILSVTQKPAFAYFYDDNPAIPGNIGSRHAFYKAGVSAFFGPPASLLGWMVGLFTDKYEVAYKITQFWGDTFNFML